LGGIRERKGERVDLNASPLRFGKRKHEGVLIMWLGDSTLRMQTLGAWMIKKHGKEMTFAKK